MWGRLSGLPFAGIPQPLLLNEMLMTFLMVPMRLLSTILVLSFIMVSNVNAATEGGAGMLFGSDHAFYFTAPEGWVLDNRSGVNQGLHMVFYPIGESWSGSPVMAYGQTVSKGGKIKSIRDQVEATVLRFHAHGNPHYRAESKPPLRLPNGSEAAIYYFQGDQWGNFEAVGYIEENKSINFIVFNARTKAAFDKYIPSFYDLLRSYRNALPGTESGASAIFAELVEKAGQQSSTPQGKKYKTSAAKELTPLAGHAMRSCIGYARSDEIRDFQTVFRIASDGRISEVHVIPENSLTTCFSGLMLNTRCSPHKFGFFLLHERMRTTE
ncbi:MAG: hypothetical protein WAW37_12865 [Syntrophobacteraceae bacterium]